MKKQLMFRSCHASVLALALSSVVCVGSAWADTRAGVDVAVAGRVASNPFQVAQPGSAAVSFSPEITPWLKYEDPDTNVEARGNARTERYLSRYGSTRSLGGTVSVQQRMSSRLTLQGGVTYSDYNSGLHNFLLSQAGIVDQVVVPGTPLSDVSTAGLRTRNQNLTGRLGASLNVSALDSITVNLSGNLSRSDASSSSDFVNQVAYVGYSRQFSSRTSGSLTAQFTNVDYFRTSRGDGTIFSPQVQITQRFSDRLTLDLSGGMTFANFSGLGGVKQKFNVLSGNLHLCNEINRGKICVNAARTVQPLALGGITTMSDVALGIDRKFGRHDTVSLSGRYSHTEQSQNAQLVGLPTVGRSFLGITANFDRKFSERFSAFITPGYSKIFNTVANLSGNSQNGQGNYEVRAGLRYRFGAI